MLMKITAKFHCGIKVLIELAKNSENEGLMQKEIAASQDMSLKFLDHIISALKTSGLIYRVAKRNGYKLSRNSSEISVYDVYRAFEPEININICLLDESVCTKTKTCGARCFLFSFNNEMKIYMRNVTIENLVAQEEKKLIEKLNLS